MFSRGFFLLRLLLYIFVVFINIECFTQNLISNPCFTKYDKCPQSYTPYKPDKRELLTGWLFVNHSSPDFFHRCAEKTDVGVGKNFAGNQYPFKGDGYIGLVLRVAPETYPFSPLYSEHVTTVLHSPLIQNENYCVSFRYAFAQNSGLQTNGLGVYISNEKPIFSDTQDMYDFQPQLKHNSDVLLNSDADWHLFSGKYTAHGNEQFLTIGNYLSLEQSIFQSNTPHNINETRHFAYYYIDDVQLYMIQDDSHCPQTVISYKTEVNDYIVRGTVDNNMDAMFVIGSTYILKNVLFDFDKSVLNVEAINELKRIVDFLKSHRHVNIVITGHTDDVGSESYNELLSELRAKAVFEYLFREGISLTRMSYKGLGKHKPIADNISPFGRQENRRVEISFY